MPAQKEKWMQEKLDEDQLVHFSSSNEKSSI